MRLKPLALLFFAIGLSLPHAAICAEADWILLDENKESSFFYDKNGSTRVREGLVRVRTRVVYTELGKKEAIKVLKELPEPARLYESRYIHEIDCIEQEGQLLAATHFDKKGAILRSTDLAPVTVMEYLSPGTRMAVIANEACGR